MQRNLTGVSHSGHAPRARKVMRTDIQALRALAVGAVLAYHFAPHLVPGGYVGVDLFFVISGFVITSLMITEVRNTGHLDFAKFYARRARRILPAATATIILTVSAGLLLMPLNTWGDLAQDALYTSVFAQNWHLAASSVDYLAGGGAPSPMQHFWSLSIEEQFYFLWPAAFVGAYLLMRRKSARGAAAFVLVPTILVTFTLSVLAVQQGDPSSYFTTHTRAWQLAVGALLAAAWPRVNSITGNTGDALEPGTAPRKGPALVLLVVGIGLSAFALLTYSEQTPFHGIGALAPTLGAAAMIAAGLPAARWVRSAPVQWLGNVSYSLYLVHWPVAIFLPRAVPDAVWAATGIGISLLLAHLSYTHIEQALPRYLTKFNPITLTRRTLLAGGVAVIIGLAVAGGTHTISNHRVAILEAEAADLQAASPAGFGAESIEAGQYTALLPGARGTAPSRASVREDLPASNTQGCVGENTDPKTPECSYGDERAERTWVLVGDSHMDQYQPAFEELAEREGVRLVTFFHANCPFSTTQTSTDVEWGGPCAQANQDRIAKIRDIDAELIFTSNWTDRQWHGDPVEGFVEAWTGLPAPLLVIADNPAMEPADGTTACVMENFPSLDACAIPKEQALPTDHQLPAAARAAQAGEKVEVLDLTEAYCTDGECPPVIGNAMVYRDTHHVTATYMRTLAPLIGERILELAAR